MPDTDSPGSTAALPLSDITVIDCTIARAGPTAVRHLADWGANVIKVEQPGTDGQDLTARDNFDFQNLHRNKRSLTLNLKTPEGLAAFMRLVKTADVVVENMRAPVKHRLKIAYEDLKAVNPRIVYGSISGFGQDGPYSERPGVDQIVQGMSGLMSVTGLPGQGPVRVGIPIADLTSGNILALGIMIALHERERTGVGRWVTTSLLESQVFMLDFQATRWLQAGEVAPQAGNDHPTGIPTGVFPASDGQINLGVSGYRVWVKFCEALGREDWLAREEWKTPRGRGKYRAEINGLIADVTRTKPVQHWVDLFAEANVPCGPIYAIDQVFADPQVQHLGMSTPMETPTGTKPVVASPIDVVGHPRNIRLPTPAMGEHTVDILSSLGYSQAEIEEMRRKGAI